MPVNIKIIHAHEFIKATPDGVLDFDSSQKLIVEIALASPPDSVYEIILDTRKVNSKLSITDLYCLAEELGKHRLSFTEKIAVLCPSDRFDKAEFFACCSQNRGFEINAFTSYEDAMGWLTIA